MLLSRQLPPAPGAIITNSLRSFRQQRRCPISLAPLFFRAASSSNSASQHHDIPTFLAYADSVNLGPETSVYVGTLYEYTVLAALRKKNMLLSRCGGRDDKGIDLRGTWLVPKPAFKPKKDLPLSLDNTTSPPTLLPFPNPSQNQNIAQIPVIVQCKANRTPPRQKPLHALKVKPTLTPRKGSVVSPKNIRELEGSLVMQPSPLSFPTSASGTDTEEGTETGTETRLPWLGILATTMPCTLGMRNAMLLSRRPLAYVCVRKEDGVVLQMIWNGAAAAMMVGIGVGMRYVEVAGEEERKEDVEEKEKEEEEEVGGRGTEEEEEEGANESSGGEGEEEDEDEEEEEEDENKVDREAVLTLNGSLIIDELLVPPQL